MYNVESDVKPQIDKIKSGVLCILIQMNQAFVEILVSGPSSKFSFDS